MLQDYMRKYDEQQYTTEALLRTLFVVNKNITFLRYNLLQATACLTAMCEIRDKGVQVLVG